MNARSKSLAENFLEYFDITYAKETYQKNNAGRVRYRVYCEEFGYEEASSFPDGIETDDFDAASLHCLITHKPSGTPAGCVRVVLAGRGGQMPFEKFCAGSLDADFFEKHPMERESMCEISRLAVDSQFRRRSGEQTTRFGVAAEKKFSLEELRTFPLFAVSCYLGATALGGMAGCTNGFAMMEPFLPRLLSHAGIAVTKVGSDIDYHGMRAPYYVTLRETLDNMYPELKALYLDIQGILESEYSAQS